MNGPIGQAALQAQGTVKQQPAACLSRPLQPQAGRGLRLQTRTGFSSCLQQGNGRSLHSPWAGHALILGRGFLICRRNVSDGAALSAGFYLTGSVRVTQRLVRRVVKQGDSTHPQHLNISFPPACVCMQWLSKREHRKQKRLSESLDLELQFSVRAVNVPNCKASSGSFLKLWFCLTEQRAEPVSSLHSLSCLRATIRQSPKIP